MQKHFDHEHYMTRVRDIFSLSLCSTLNIFRRLSRFRFSNVNMRSLSFCFSIGMSSFSLLISFLDSFGSSGIVMSFRCGIIIFTCPFSSCSTDSMSLSGTSSGITFWNIHDNRLDFDCSTIKNMEIRVGISTKHQGKFLIQNTTKSQLHKRLDMDKVWTRYVESEDGRRLL